MSSTTPSEDLPVLRLELVKNGPPASLLSAFLAPLTPGDQPGLYTTPTFTPPAGRSGLPITLTVATPSCPTLPSELSRDTRLRFHATLYDVSDPRQVAHVQHSVYSSVRASVPRYPRLATNVVIGFLPRGRTACAGRHPRDVHAAVMSVFGWGDEPTICWGHLLIAEDTARADVAAAWDEIAHMAREAEYALRTCGWGRSIQSVTMGLLLCPCLWPVALPALWVYGRCRPGRHGRVWNEVVGKGVQMKMVWYKGEKRRWKWVRRWRRLRGEKVFDIENVEGVEKVDITHVRLR